MFLYSQFSPGTGRTGTLLAVDICMRSLDDTETADILGTVHTLRQDRAGAVQTQEQYVFIYQVRRHLVFPLVFGMLAAKLLVS